MAISAPHAAAAACVNRFVQRREAPGRWVVTLLTGRLTYQEAQTLTREITAGRSAPLDWVDDRGKSLGKQIGLLRVVRPMPVACEGKSSGSILLATFLAPKPPAGKMNVKFNSAMTVEFEEQK